MASRRKGPYAGAMISGQSDEHATLVALLQARPEGLSWPEIAAELLEVGSAVEVWERHAPAPALIDFPGDVTPESAAEDVRSWKSQGYRLLSILDPDYPVWLRGVQQAPPVIFTLGTVISDDAAVSVVPYGPFCRDAIRAFKSNLCSSQFYYGRGIDNDSDAIEPR